MNLVALGLVVAILALYAVIGLSVFAELWERWQRRELRRR